MSFRKEKIQELLHHLAAEFLGKESGPQSLITVTGVSFNEKKNSAIVFISVLPKEKEEVAIDFVSRKIRDFKDHIKKNSKIGAIPFVSFSLDPSKN